MSKKSTKQTKQNGTSKRKQTKQESVIQEMQKETAQETQAVQETQIKEESVTQEMQKETTQETQVKEVVLKEYLSGDFAYYSGLGNKNKVKYLGGEDVVRTSKYFSTKGVGGWIYEWLIYASNIPKVKKSLEKYGYKLILERWDKDAKKYYISEE